MLSIKSDFSISDIKKDFDLFEDSVEGFAERSLIETGKKFVDKARAKTKANGGFGNVTWNLRGSIGFVLVKDHKIVFTYFPPYPKGSEGVKQGIAYANEIAGLFDDGGMMIVCVAGMQYAAAVENSHDLDVISGSCARFESDFKSILAG